jgi:hypothetical protein
MILRLGSPAARWVLLLTSVLLAGGLSYYSLRNAWAEHRAEPQTPEGLQRATQLEPGNARQWYLLGHYWQYNLDQPDTPRAIALYRKSLSFNPNAPATWLDLGEAYESEGQFASASEASREAKHTHPISAEVAWRYGNFLLRQGDLPAAFAEIRRSVMAEPARAAEAASRCWRADPDVKAILDQALPASRDVYLSAIRYFAGEKETGAGLEVWARLVQLEPKIFLQEVHPLFEALIAKRQIAQAQRVWNQALTLAGVERPPAVQGSLIWDGGFEKDVLDIGFAWRFRPVPGIKIGLDENEKHSGGRALGVRFTGAENVAYADACQYVAVEPGTSYRFSAWMRAEAVTTDTGVYFRVITPEFPERGAAVTRELRGTEPWTQITVPWKAAKDVRYVQVCLARDPSAKLDNKIAGTAWVDDVALIPEPGNSSASGKEKP